MSRAEMLTLHQKMWKASEKAKHSLVWHCEGNNCTLTNTSADPVELTYKSTINVLVSSVKGLKLSFKGTILKNSGACLYINTHSVPLGSTVSMPISAPMMCSFTIKIHGDSSVQMDSIEYELQQEIEDITEQCNKTADVLVITPDYPSSHNLYLCAFAHSRNSEYIRNGLSIQVASVNEYKWYQTVYEHDGVPVFSGSYLDLKKLLERKQYKTIVVHFVNEKLYQIFDGHVLREQLVFICHGPETTFRIIPNVARPYFSKELPAYDHSSNFDLKEAYVRKYAQKDNVEWVFVSDWLKEKSEEILGLQFRHACVIHNTINQQLFPYCRKCADDRKKILVLRKFDDIAYHSIDQIVRCILELSHRDFFNELTIDIYGDGDAFDRLVAPLRQFDNVSLTKSFIPNNEIHRLHAEHGILLIPSRHDSQGVAMGEAASSGLVVVGSDVTCVGHFMNQAANHTLAHPENPIELADIIERLYRNPDEFLEISERMSKETQARCCKEKTVHKEIELIQKKIIQSKNTLTYPEQVCCAKEPILTIVVPAYNVEKWLDKCLYTLMDHRNAHKQEIIVVNDGSKDATLEIAYRYAEATRGVVSVIDKENGGHGSTINAGIDAARGKYFRLIDGDDWVESENLAKLIDILETETTDLVLTKGCYDYADQTEFVNIIDYDMLSEGAVYRFDDLLYEGYGFETYGPLLTTSNYRTELLKAADFRISEKKPYVDMEFNSFSLRYVQTVSHYRLDIYRYLIGRAGQTVSRDFWKKKYNDHRYVIFNVLKTLDKMEDYPVAKRQYVYHHLLAIMIDSQIFMYDQLCLWSEIDRFFEELSQWPEVLEAGKQYIKKKNGDCKIILKGYKAKILAKSKSPIIGANSINREKPRQSMKWYAKKAIKAIVPYGIIRMWQKRKYGF